MNGTRVKICGLTRATDVAMAVAAGAWAVGVVLWPDSPRAVAPSRVRELLSDVPPGVSRVGVVVNAGPEEARRLRDDTGLTTLQLHGDEDVTRFLPLGMNLIKAVSLASDADEARAATLPAEVMVLVDAHDPVRRGGTGQRADWTRAARLARRRPILLAGGLRPENVREAIEGVGPWAIDVSSGIESAKGIKDGSKLRALFEALKGSEEEGGQGGTRND